MVEILSDQTSELQRLAVLAAESRSVKVPPQGKATADRTSEKR